MVQCLPWRPSSSVVLAYFVFVQHCDTNGLPLRKHWRFGYDGSVGCFRLNSTRLLSDGHSVPISHVSWCTWAMHFVLLSRFTIFIAKPSIIKCNTILDTRSCCMRAGVRQVFAGTLWSALRKNQPRARAEGNFDEDLVRPS